MDTERTDAVESSGLSISSVSKKVLECLHHSSFDNLSDLLKDMNARNPTLGPHIGDIARKVPAILTVLSAAGMVSQRDRQVSLHKPCFQYSDRLLEREHTLYDRIRTLVLYRALMRRNINRCKTQSSLNLPLIVVATNGEADIQRDSSKTEIRTSTQPMFYSPTDIIGKLGVSREEELTVLRELQLPDDVVSFYIQKSS